MRKYSWQKILAVVVAVAAIFWLSFYYAFLTNFPIGHDAGHHVLNAIRIENSGFLNLEFFKAALYPIPLILFALFHKISQIAWPQLFLYTICLFLFLTCVMWAYFTTKISENWKIGIISGVLLASSRWISDALRIGFLGEAWGWFIFILASYFLVKRKFWPLLILLVILFFSHPLVLAVFLVVLILYSLVILISSPEKEDKQFFAKIFSILLIAIAGILILNPEKFQPFNHLSIFRYLEGARSLKIMMMDSDKRRILLYLIGLVGLVKSIRWWGKREIKYLFVLLSVSVILSQLYLWEINFWVFRFYPYFEMTMAFFAAVGLYYLIELSREFFAKRGIKPWPVIILIVLLLVLPNIKVNKSITLWQKDNPEVLAICPSQDKEAFLWVKNNLPKDAVLVSAVKWGAWLGPLSERKVLEIDYIFSSEKMAKEIENFARKDIVDYFYFSSIQKKDPIIEENYKLFELIYNKDGVRIYKVKR